MLLVDWIGTLGLPLLFCSIFLVVSHQYQIVNQWFDWTALAISIGAGVACLWRVCRNSTSFAVFAPTYIIATGLGLILYSLWFVGTFFGRWL